MKARSSAVRWQGKRGGRGRGAMAVVALDRQSGQESQAARIPDIDFGSFGEAELGRRRVK